MGPGVEWAPAATSDGGCVVGFCGWMDGWREGGREGGRGWRDVNGIVWAPAATSDGGCVRWGSVLSCSAVLCCGWMDGGAYVNCVGILYVYLYILNGVGRCVHSLCV